MAGLYNAFYAVQFFLFLGIFLIKIYNVMSVGRFYESARQRKNDSEVEQDEGMIKDPHIGPKISFILFAATILLWGVALLVFLADPEEQLFYTLFMLQSWMLPVHVLMLFSELMIYFSIRIKSHIQAFKTNDMPAMAYGSKK